MKSCENKTAVTLIEMLIVLAVIMLLATLALGIAGVLHRQSNERLTQWTFKLLDEALEQYYDYKGYFPLQPDDNPGDDNDESVIQGHSMLLYDDLYNSVPACRRILMQVKENDRADIALQHRVYDGWGSVIDYRYKAGWAFPELVSPGPDKKFALKNSEGNKDKDNLSSKR
jgi:hypothetical protein